MIILFAKCVAIALQDEDSGDHILQASKWDTLEHSQEKLSNILEKKVVESCEHIILIVTWVLNRQTGWFGEKETRDE